MVAWGSIHKTTLWPSKFESVKSFAFYHCSQHWWQWAPCGQNAIECITHNSRPWLALRFSPLLPGSHLSLQESSFLQWCGYFYSSWLVKWEKWRENWLLCHSVVPIRNQWCSLRMLLMCCRAQAGTHTHTHTRTWGGHCQNVPLIDRLIFPLDVIHYPQCTNTPGLHNDTQQVEINVFVKDESKECEFKQQHHLNW